MQTMFVSGMMALGLPCTRLRGFPKKLFVNPISFLCHESCLVGTQRCQYLNRVFSTKPNTSTPVATNPSPPSIDKKNAFITIYKMPYIRHLATIHNIKVQQLLLTSVATPIASILSYTGHFPAGTGWTVGAVGFLICTFFCSLSLFGSNVVGFIYVSTDNSIVRISYVDGWGRRVDDEFPVDDLVPLSELRKSFYAPLYYKLQRYSIQRRGGLYRLNISEASQITDQDRFTNLFGKIEM